MVSGPSAAEAVRPSGASSVSARSAASSRSAAFCLFFMCFSLLFLRLFVLRSGFFTGLRLRLGFRRRRRVGVLAGVRLCLAGEQADVHVTVDIGVDDAVDLVIYAFEHGHNGDLFVQKAPATTLDVLAQALKEIYAQVDPKYGETEVKTIGTRHGEKLYETLVTREEMAKAVDMGDYYRIPCDTRDLNYDKFFTEGNEDIARIEDYHSHNTARLDVEGMKKLLLKLRFIREDLGMEEKAKSAEIKSE